MKRFIPFSLLLLLSPAVAQERHHDDVEVIEAPAVPDRTPTPDLAALSASIIERTNAFRKEEGREAVRKNDKLAAAAQYFAEYLAKNDRYGHTADGSAPADRAKKHGYDCCLVSENIAYAYNSNGFTADRLAEKFTTGWKNSPGHRRNMLDLDVKETAVAVARSEKTGYYYAVQMFGRPKAEAIEFSIKNDAGEPFDYRIDDRAFTLEPRYTRTHTVCRPPEILFQFGDQKGEPVKATAGERLTVTKADGNWQVRK